MGKPIKKTYYVAWGSFGKRVFKRYHRVLKFVNGIMDYTEWVYVNKCTVIEKGSWGSYSSEPVIEIENGCIRIPVNSNFKPLVMKTKTFYKWFKKGR